MDRASLFFLTKGIVTQYFSLLITSFAICKSILQRFVITVETSLVFIISKARLSFMEKKKKKKTRSIFRSIEVALAEYKFQSRWNFITNEPIVFRVYHFLEFVLSNTRNELEAQLLNGELITGILRMLWLRSTPSRKIYELIKRLAFSKTTHVARNVS